MKPMPLGRFHIPSHQADIVPSKWENSRTYRLASQDDRVAQTHATEILPTVIMKEIEYTNEHDPNPLYREKRYSTTVEEFQEVLRRVREQAEMYGCSGSQSKDPVYDAEQDIRWAIADNKPIPLLMGPPNHVAYPRPWNWADSAYNSNRNLKNEAELDESSGDEIDNPPPILTGLKEKPRELRMELKGELKMELKLERDGHGL
ncbi:MAG: hypothetical protein LQ350_003238 [Teloschistes chrysophthalmus]|nr:MAG: hypothetical protein LQ350_003238 [Niorma chrysophthalma]